MSSKRSMLNLLVILSLVVTLLIACGPTPEPTKAPEPTEAPAATKAPEPEPTEAAEPPPEPEAAMDDVSQIEFTDPVELEFWHTKTGSQEELLNEIVADFNDSNEYGITVVPTSIEGSYDQIFKDTVAGLAVGEVPDLVVAYPSMVAEYMEAEAPLALDPYIASEKYGLTGDELADYFPVYIEDNTYPAYDNQMLSWPFHKSMVTMYANETLLAEAGVEKMPETWAEFYDACKMVVEDTAATNCWSIHVEASDLDGFMASVGVYPQVDSAALTSRMNDPAFVEWFELVQQMVDEGLARPEAERYSGDDEMIAGDAAFTTGSTSGIFYFPKNEDGTFAIDWKVIPIPSAEGIDPISTVYGANVMAVQEDDVQRDLAKWLFIKYWSSPEMVKKWILGTEELRGSSYMPLQKSLAEDADVQAFMEKEPRWGEAVLQLGIGVIEPQLAGQQAVRDILEDAFLRIIGGEDVQTVLDDGKALADEAFQLKGEPVEAPPEPEAAMDDVSQIEFTDPVELEFWHTKTGSQEELLNEIVADFNDGNEYGITVVPTSIEGSYDQIFKDTVAGLAVGEVPDLVVAYPSMVAEYMEAEAPLALDPYIASEKYGLTGDELADYFPVYIEDNTYPAYDNQMLSWPFHKSMVTMYANETLLAEAGVEKMPETWAEFYDACKMVVENTAATNCWSIHVEASDLDGFMASVGVYPQVDSAALTSRMNDPAFVEWFELVQQMVDEGLARPEAERYSGDDEMIAGDAAFTTGSTSGIFYFPKNEDGTFAIDWKVIPIPSAEGIDPISTVYGANVMAVQEDDVQRDLAKWLFIKYWSSPEMVKKWILGTEELRGSSYMPLQKSLAEDADVLAFMEKEPRWGEAVLQLGIGVIEPQLAGQQAVRDILEDAFLRIIGGEDVQTVLDEAKALADEAFQLKGGQ